MDAQPERATGPKSNDLSEPEYSVGDDKAAGRGVNSAHSPLRFVALTLAVACVLAAVAWLTGLRAVFHGGLIVLCVFAFFPVVVIACILGATVIVGLVLGIVTAGDGGVHASDLAGYSETLLYAKRGTRAYYSFLARNARSVWLGIPAGVLLGWRYTARRFSSCTPIIARHSASSASSFQES